LVWRPSTSVPGTADRPRPTAHTVAAAGRAALQVLWATAVAAAIGGFGELFRYVLLVVGRNRSLPGTLVAVSDALVSTGAVLSLCLGLVALGLTVRWLFAARQVATELAGVRPARPDRAVALGVLLPGLNLFVAGSVLAELEHTARQQVGRIRPSRLVLAWWLAWAGGEVLALLTLLLRLRTGVQAQADSVLWHAATDLVAVALAVLTARVVGSFTRLLGPATPAGLRLTRVVSVTNAPAPPLRPARPPGSRR
jgi:hypothetical protein